MDQEELDARVDRIKQTLMTIKPHYFANNRNGGKDIRVRCPYCGDSRKDATSAHMYIDLEPPFQFHCFRCDASGVINSDTIKDLKIHDSDIILDVTYVNKSLRGKISQKATTIRKTLDFTTALSEVVFENLNYFNSRYEKNYSINDVQELADKYRIVFDPFAFLKQNKIDIQLSGFDFNKAIGFVSSDGGFIIFRDNSNSQEKRYYNLRLDKNSNSKKRYTVNTDVNIMSPKLNLIMTEGIFDIIGVKEFFYKDVTDTSYIFTAVCGKSYSEAIKYYMRMGFLDLNIIIYSDKDVDLKFYRDLKASISLLKFSQITIYYNDLEKDYGIPENRIKLRKVVI